ncbi:MAG: YebC/PmpR family DNA-binding transcriptional regulator [Dehalococcoidia bacterium]
MSGHSKWSQIKRQKGAADARRGQMFTKLGREIAVAARQGADPETNFRLRLAVQRARDSNMPLENVERAIKRGTGGGEGANLVEMTLEGYGPHGVAIFLEATTDNRNRTLQEVRNFFSRNGGSLSESGTVAWLFESRGVITVSAGGEEAEEVALEAIDAGAADVKMEEGYLEVYTTPTDLETVRKALSERGRAISSAELSMVSKTQVTLDDKVALQTLRLLDRLEELDEVQHVYCNADFPDSVLEEYSRS